MEIIKKLTTDLARIGLPNRTAAVRGDSALWLEFDMRCNGEAWTMPTAATVLVRYRLSSGAGGEYDTVDSARAWQTEGNLLRVALAPAVCSAAGETQVQVVIIEDDRQISTLPVTVFVTDAVTGTGAPEDYTNLTQWLKFHTVDGELSLGELESRVIALEQALAAHMADTHLTQEDVRQIIQDEGWVTE